MKTPLPGRVERVVDATVYAVVPALGTEPAPVKWMTHRYQTEDMDDPAFTLPPRAGDLVYVDLIEGSIHDPVIIGLQP